MRRSPSPRSTVRPRVARLVAGVATPAFALLALTPPASAGEIIVEPITTETTLVVTPGDRTEPGVELTFTATVVEEHSGDPVVGEPLRFLVDNEVLDIVDLDAAGQAVATVTPPQGAHVVHAALIQGGDDPYATSSAVVRQSVVPETCVDAAQPGTGAVVRHAYLVALGRCPDPAGYAFWVDRLGVPFVPGPAASAPARTAEAVEAAVDDAYLRILGRPADRAGRAVWAAKLRAGWATSQLWAALAASPELAMGTSGRGELVERAFVRIVGRPSDAAGHAYWLSRLAAGPPSSTWRALAVTAEVVDSVVRDAHVAALGRPPTADEALAAHTTIRTHRGDWRPLRAGLLARSEAATYAQRYPDPETDI